MEIRPSAHRHGKTVEDIQHAVDHQVAQGFVVTNQAFNATGTMVIGPDLAGNLIEVISVDDPNIGDVVIHAMQLRRVNAQRLLGGGS